MVVVFQPTGDYFNGLLTVNVTCILMYIKKMYDVIYVYIQMCTGITKDECLKKLLSYRETAVAGFVSFTKVLFIGKHFYCVAHRVLSLEL